MQEKILNTYQMYDCGDNQGYTFQVRQNMIIHRLIRSSRCVESPIDHFASHEISNEAELQDERLFVVSPKQHQHLQSISSSERYQSYPKCVCILNVGGVDEGIDITSNITEHKLKPHTSILARNKGSIHNVIMQL